MKRIIVFFAFLLIGFGQGCRTQHYLITDIRFSLAEIKEDKYKDKQQRVYGCSSVVKEKLIFVISYHTEFIAQTSFPAIGSSCYALTLPSKIDNPLQENSFSLSFDQPFTYHGTVITEGSNVFEVENIREEIDMYENYMSFCNMGADKVIEFRSSFFEHATFNEKEHKVKFHCKTSDDVYLNKEVAIKFE